MVWNMISGCSPIKNSKFQNDKNGIGQKWNETKSEPGQNGIRQKWNQIKMKSDQN